VAASKQKKSLPYNNQVEDRKMKNKVKVALMMFALVIGLSVSAGAQTIRRRPNGRTVVVLQNRDWQNRNWQNRNRVNRNWHGWENNRQMRGARVVRLPNGRLVTILPNGRRIYR
jgi:hypothetical protein